MDAADVSELWKITDGSLLPNGMMPLLPAKELAAGMAELQTAMTAVNPAMENLIAGPVPRSISMHTMRRGLQDLTSGAMSQGAGVIRLS
jgi:hypothetical protein